MLNTKKRVDGRATNEVRPISIDTSLLPRAHGSALFTRGQTQALVAVTLGTVDGRTLWRVALVSHGISLSSTEAVARSLPTILHANY